jgi:hypothetical protein
MMEQSIPLLTIEISVLIVQTCDSSLWMLLSSLVFSEGVTDLWASYNLFLVSRQKTTVFPYIQSYRKGTMSTREASL